MSVFVYLMSVGVVFGICISGYQYRDVLDIIFMGQTQNGRILIIEMLTSFGFYYLVTSYISKRLEKVMDVYDYIQIRAAVGKNICVQRMIISVIQSVGLIMLQKILADVLMSLFICHVLAVDYWYQTILLLFSLLMLGCGEIAFFYMGCKPIRMKMYIDIILLVLLLCNGKELLLPALFIPVFCEYKEHMMLLVIGKLAIIWMLCVWTWKRAKKFERIDLYE